MVHGLQNGQVDAIFTFEFGVDELAGKGVALEPISESINCGIGDSLHYITRKDSKLLSWFNKTLKEMKENGKYYKLCREAVDKHGKKGKIDCLRD
ncbi:arginine-binding periplasmic protein-like [Glandiceps talaboti]